MPKIIFVLGGPGAGKGINYEVKILCTPVPFFVAFFYFGPFFGVFFLKITVGAFFVNMFLTRQNKLFVLFL